MANVAKSYPGDVAVEVLKGISLRIDRGEFVAIVGRSGSGKTTLLQILGTLDRPSAGEVFVDGVSTRALTDDALSALRARTIGFVFQQFLLLDILSTRANVALGALYAISERRLRFRLADEALAQVSLSHRSNHRANQLSGGERQRAAIARALIMRPKVILADEPTGNLDSKSGAVVLDLLASLRNEGTAVVIVTHEIAIARQADRVVEVADGHVIAGSAG